MSINLNHIIDQVVKEKGIDIDQYTVALPQREHLSGVHGRGNEGMPGGWNARWERFFKENQRAEAPEILDFMRQLTAEYGLSGLPIGPYK